MKLLLIIATSILVYLYWVELIKPWLASKKRNKIKETVLLNKEQLNEQTDALRYQSARMDVRNQIDSLLSVNYLTVDNNESLLLQINTVNINEPVLLIGKADNYKIYYPDNSVELFSGNRWKKYQTPHQSVYAYATLTKSTIVENLG